MARYFVRLPTPLVTASARHTERRGLILRIDYGDHAGWGEAAPLRGHDDVPLDAVEEVLETVASRWRREAAAWMGTSQTGRGVPEAVRALVAGGGAGRHAAGAFCTALAALRADAAGLPLARWLEPTAASRVAVNAVIGGGTAAAAVGEARRAVAGGYRTLKLKVGQAKDHRFTSDSDVERVGAVREAIGSAMAIRLDANGAWPTTAVALARIEALARFDIEYVEQPVPAIDVRSLAELRRRSIVPVAADESLLVDGGPEMVVAEEAADVWILKPTLCGGVQQGVRLAHLATQSGAKVVVTSALDSMVGRTAALHLAAAAGSPGFAHGLATDRLMEGGIGDTAWRVVGGEAEVPALPGLGILPAANALARLVWREIGVGKDVGSRRVVALTGSIEIPGESDGQ